MMVCAVCGGNKNALKVIWHPGDKKGDHEKGGGKDDSGKKKGGKGDSGKKKGGKGDDDAQASATADAQSNSGKQETTPPPVGGKMFTDTGTVSGTMLAVLQRLDAQMPVMHYAHWHVPFR